MPLVSKNKKKLLLHSCCAPCSTYVVELLRPEFDVTAYFYNPNIHPRKEYEIRLGEMKRICQRLGIYLVGGEYEVEEWFQRVKGLETEREGGKRCTVCFYLRLDKTAAYAKDCNYQYYATTLTISPHKDVKIINQIGRELQEKYGINFYEADFKKKDGFKKSCQLSKEHGLYRQNYCGCIFSKKKL